MRGRRLGGPIAGVAAGLLLACGGGDTNDPRPELPPGSVIVASKDTFQSGGLATFGPADLALSGDDLALLLFSGSTTFFEHSTPVIVSDPGGVGAYYDSVSRAAGSLSDGGYQLALSHDRGATWAVHPVPGWVSSVRLVGKRLFLVLAFGMTSELGGTWDEYEIHEFFPDTDQLGPVIGQRITGVQQAGFRRVEFTGSKATAYQVNWDQTADVHGADTYPTVRAGTIDWIQIDVLSGQVLSKQLIFSNAQGQDLQGALPFFSADGGDDYQSFTRPVHDGFRRRCVASASLSFAPAAGGPTLLPSPRCWPAVEFPPGFGSLAITDAGVVQTWWENGATGDEAWAMRMANGKPEPVFLGPGRPVGWLPWGAVHAHFGGLVEVRDNVPSKVNGSLYTTRFVRVPPSGPALEVPLVVAGDLPGTVLGYVPSLAAQFQDGSWLTVFSTTTFRDPKYAVGPIGWVFVRHETHGPEVPIPARTRAQRFPGCLPEPSPATAVDEACIRYASTCGEYIQGFQLYACVRDLLAATPEARAAFLAAPPACGGTWTTPEAVSADPNCSPVGKNTCAGDTLVQCFGTIRAMDCAPLGLSCEPDPDSDAVPPKDHLDALGVENGAACGYTNCPRPDLTGKGGWCAGHVAFFPISDATDRAVDCRALGYDTCKEGPRYPYCTGTPPVLPEAVPAGPLERACARAVACGLKSDVMPGDALVNCVEDLASGSWAAVDDAHDPWFARLVAADSCDALAAALADRYLPDTVDPACAGATSPQCSPSGGVCYAADTYEDCPARGLACHDAGGSFACGMAVLGCVPNQNRCVGTTDVACTDTNVGLAVKHCGWLPGFACSPTGGCEPLVRDASCDPLSAPVASCDGSVLHYCAYGSGRALDCAAIGATCSMASGVARCAAP